MPENPHQMFFPLETLILRLEREGFTFGIDQHLRLQKVLQDLGQDYLKEPKKLRDILAPVLVYSQDGAKTFDRVFDEYIDLVVQPSINQHLFNQENPHTQDGHIVIDPQIKWHTALFRWKVPLIGILILAIGAGIFIFTQKTGLKPEFSVQKIKRATKQTLMPEDRVYVGDSLLFENRSIEEYEKRGEENMWQSAQKEISFFWKIEDGDQSLLSPESSQHSARLGYRFEREGLFLASLVVRGATGELVEDTIKTQLIRVYCDKQVTLKKGDIEPNPASKIKPVVGKEIPFSLETADNSYKVSWKINDKLIRLQDGKYAFKKPGTYRIHIHATPPTGDTSICNQIDTTIYLTVIPESKQFSLDPLPMENDPTGEYKYGFSMWALLFPSLLTMFLIFWRDRVRLRRKRKKLLREDTFEKSGQGEGPYEIPFPSKDYLLAHDPQIYGLANLMRQRRESDRHKFDIRSTLKETAKSLGMLNLRFLKTSKASEYLILIEQIHPQSHIAKLFARLVQMLKGEDVLLEVFYFDSDIRICWNEDFPDGIRLEALRQKYSGHRLLLYSSAYHLIDSYEAKLKTWVHGILNTWKGRAALITPIPVGDWGYREKLLSKYFYLLAAELSSQEKILELFMDEENSSYEQALLFAKEASQDPQESLLDYDFNSVEDIKLYLGDTHFELLAACMVYPLPTWEVTLIMAQTLSIRTDSEYLQTYPTFLRLARIPWLQTGLLSPNLRRELLNTLSPETEYLARKAVLELMDQVGIKDNSHAGRKLVVQSISNKFLTEPGDKEIARKMYVLWQKGLIVDPVIEERLHKKSAQLGGGSSDNYLRTRFEVITPMRTLLKVMFLTALVALGTYGLYDKYEGKPSLKGFTQEYELDKYWLTEPIGLDSAAYYNNKGVEDFNKGEMLQARKNFYLAMQFRHYDLLKEKLNDNTISLDSASRKPVWPVELIVEGAPDERLFGMVMDERLQDLDNIQDNGTFDDAILSSFDRSRIYIEGEYVNKIKFKNKKFDNSFGKREGLLAAYLFNYDYPIAGRNLLSLISYNEGVEAFNNKNYKKAIDDLSIDLGLLSAGLTKADSALLTPLLLEVIHATSLSYYFYNNEVKAQHLAGLLTDYSPTYFEEKKEFGELHLFTFLDSLKAYNPSIKKKDIVLENKDWDKVVGIISECEGTSINLAKPINIVAQKIIQDSLSYLGQEPLADPAGIIHRVLDSLRSFTPNCYEKHNEDRESWDLAQHYSDNQSLIRVRNPLDMTAYIKPGVLMFYGGRGKNFNKLSNPKLFRRGGINHVGVVTSVERDIDGNVIKFGLFHAIRPGKIANITYETKGDYPAGKEYMAFGNQNNQWVAVAPILPTSDSLFTKIKTE